MEHGLASTPRVVPLDRPVVVDARAVRARAVRVAAVVPCFDRPADLALLLDDLARCETRHERGGGVRSIDLRVIVVDNASREPLEGVGAPADLRVEWVRLAVNTGGSGGYNAGMAVALQASGDEPPDFLWLVDSDARVEPGTLGAMLDAMERDDGLVIAGAAIADPETDEVFEVGGRVCRRTGSFVPALASHPDDSAGVVPCDYVASCCALVRAPAARAGLMPRVFLNGDDVEWCIRLARAAGGHVAAVPAARARHPRFDRFPLGQRYYSARNAFAPLAALGLGPLVRFRRAMLEAARAVNQELMARPDLARLHLAGLRDGARGRTTGSMPTGVRHPEPVRPWSDLAGALTEASRDAKDKRCTISLPADLGSETARTVIRETRAAGFTPVRTATRNQRTERVRAGVGAFLRHAIAGPPVDLAVVPAKGRPVDWLAGRTLIAVTAGGFSIRRVPRARTLARAVLTAARGGVLAARIAVRPARPAGLPPPEAVRAFTPRSSRERGLTLSVVVLSYNRRDSLLETLRRLRAGPATRDAEIIVADNASADGTPDAVREHAPWARLVQLPTNEAIAGFNRGAAAARGDALLILDDDARPDDDALAHALALLAARSDLAAVTFVPVHPATGACEWPFARRLEGPRDDWPVMGCCNLVRTAAWRALGGYDEAFQLYRNDVDLAMRLLAAGGGVHVNPDWRCEHDSPAAARKSDRWFRTATRNWVWLARRHGRGLWRAVGLAFGWLWAHRLAGTSLRSHAAVARGALEGLSRRPGATPDWLAPDGRAWERFIRLHLASRRRPRP
ncbi:MAG: glycosyltransferase [Phycisphaeraceae bacterium]|nr:glycosyltransferase [Phycisphaeraceae bacterium]